MPITHYSEDEVLRLTDDELVSAVYDCVRRVDDHTVSDDLYWVIAEAFERFAPEAESRNVERMYADEDDPGELEAARRAVRRRQGARMLRDLFREGDEGRDEA